MDAVDVERSRAENRRSQKRRRSVLSERGYAQQSVWLRRPIKALVDRSVEEGRFKTRSEAIEWAVAAAFGEKST